MHADVRIRVRPRATRHAIERRGDAIVVRVAAPPVDGKANEAVCKVVAEAAGVPRSRVSVIRGHTARDKTIRVEGVAPDELPPSLRAA